MAYLPGEGVKLQGGNLPPEEYYPQLEGSYHPTEGDNLPIEGDNLLSKEDNLP